MFFRFKIFLILFIFLGACATPVTHYTDSGKPEVSIPGVTREEVKSHLINQMINRGYSITHETDFLISFDAPVQNFWAAVLLGSRYDSQPNARLTFSLAQIGDIIRVIADMQIVTNPHSAFERFTPMNNSKDSLMVQGWLDDLKLNISQKTTQNLTSKNQSDPIYTAQLSPTQNQEENFSRSNQGERPQRLTGTYILSEEGLENGLDDVVLNQETPIEDLIYYANEGNASAQALLAYRYETGADVKKNEEEAFRLYLLSAEQGNLDSQYNLGLMALQGRGTEKNPEEAVKWFTLAANQGDLDSMVNLGALYDLGNGIPKDHQKAVYWYKLAAEDGSTEGQINLGNRYSKGLGVPENYPLAYMWFNLASQSGDVRAFERKENLKEIMTPEQIAEGQRLTLEWLNNH